MTSTNTNVPQIGQPWPGQGGLYAGVARGRDGAPDCHLILAADKPETDLTWKRGIAWAMAVTVDGHSDFTLPTRFESALLYANLQEQFEPRWHWTGTQYSASSAWTQHFGSGFQYNDVKRDKARCRAVRRLPINPSILSTVDADGAVA